MSDKTADLRRSCTACKRLMDPEHAWWWTPYGTVCSEGCVRHLVRDHEGGIHLTLHKVVPEVCGDCARSLAHPDEMESGLCLRCLNGPVPGLPS